MLKLFSLLVEEKSCFLKKSIPPLLDWQHRRTSVVFTMEKAPVITNLTCVNPMCDLVNSIWSEIPYGFMNVTDVLSHETVAHLV